MEGGAMQQQSIIIVIEEQLSLLRDDETRVRLRAIGNLGRSSDGRAIPPLCDLLLHDDVPDVRARAASALGQLGSPLAIPALSQALADADPEVRRRAIQALNQINDDAALEALISALVDTDRDVRRWAARGLGKIGDPVALNPLTQLQNDVNIVVQDEAAQAMRAIHDRQSLHAQRTKVEELRQQRSRPEMTDPLTQARLDGQIDLEQLSIYRLEARLAARDAALPAPDDGVEQDRERRSTTYKLQGLMRELDSLSNSVRAVRMREAWESQLHETEKILAIWANSTNDLSLENMQAELKLLRKRMDERFDTQKNELIELTRFIQEGYSIQLQTEQIHDSLADPINRAKVENWRHAAEAEYNLLKVAHDQGDYTVAKEHFANLTALRERTEKLQDLESKAKQATGKSVILFIIISILGLTSILYLLKWLGLETGAVPALGVPYAVVSWSVMGSVAAMLYQFLNRPVNQLETFKWLIARPIQGIIMGSFLYLVIAGGLLVLGNTTASNSSPGPQLPASIGTIVRPELAAVIAFLGGFSDRFADEMVKRATSILTRD
jgi:hypothetical protein